MTYWCQVSLFQSYLIHPLQGWCVLGLSVPTRPTPSNGACLQNDTCISLVLDKTMKRAALHSPSPPVQEYMDAETFQESQGHTTLMHYDHDTPKSLISPISSPPPHVVTEYASNVPATNCIFSCQSTTCKTHLNHVFSRINTHSNW